MTLSRSIARGLSAIALAGLISSHSFAADPPAPKPFTLRVLDAGTKQPIANATIKYSGEKNKLLKAATDAEGKFTFNLPTTTPNVYLSIDDPTHVPMTMRWSPTQEPGHDHYDAMLPMAVPISGRVQDEAGEPVAGAKVSISMMNSRSPEWPHTYIQIGQESVGTDENGVWTYNQTPEDISQLALGVTHPQYVVNDRNEAYYSYERVTNPSTLRDGTYTATLKKGVAITGHVLDTDGKPITTATVAIGTDRFASNVVPPVKVDTDGKFTLAAMPNAPLTITTMAKGKAPDLTVIQVTNEPPEVTIKLAAPQPLTGKVVDAEGKPIRGVTVAVDTWRGTRTLQKRMSTNAEGKFTWAEAPADEVLVDVMDATHAASRNVKMSPGKENVVTLNSPLTVTATVVDDTTGQPVPSFTIIRGIKFGPDDTRISWQRHEYDQPESRGTNGAFTRNFNEGYQGIAIHIEAPGYLPAESPAWPNNAGAVKYEFRLKKGKDIAGVVTDADGKPAANVQVVLAQPGNPMQLLNGKLPPYMGRGANTLTDEQGKFSFSPQLGNFAVIAFGDAGYAEVKAEQFKNDPPTIKLAAWGRIEGQAFTGSKPAPDVQLDGNMNRNGFQDDQPAIWPRYETKTDENGKFVFDRVIPGSDIMIGRRIQLSTNSYTSSRGATITVKAGETQTVRVGGTGRPVVGSIKLDPSLAGQSWGYYSTHLMSTEQNRLLPPQPAGFDKMTPEERRTYWTNWYKTEEGKAFRAQLAGAERRTRFYGFALNTDGTFRIDDVEPGTYTLNVQLQKPTNDERRGMNEEILAMANVEVTVPPIPNGTQSDEAVNVPEIIAKSPKEFQNQMTARRATSAPASQPARQ